MQARYPGDFAGRQVLYSINVNQSRSSPLNKATAAILNRMPITKARINLGQLAKRAHLNNEYFILEKDGIPVIGIMDADELEDYLELRDPKVRAQIVQSNRDVRSGRTRPAEALLHELGGQFCETITPPVQITVEFWVLTTSRTAARRHLPIAATAPAVQAHSGSLSCCGSGSQKLDVNPTA
jgi:hypothetical protein